MASFIGQVGVVKYVEHVNPEELYTELRSLNIDVHLVSAYMILGNMQRHAKEKDGIFYGVVEFSTTDPFVGCCHGYLMINFFLKECDVNLFGRIPGLEIMSGARTPSFTEWLTRKVSTYEKKVCECKEKLRWENLNGFKAHFFQKEKEEE